MSRKYIPLPAQIRNLTAMGYSSKEISNILDCNRNTVAGLASKNAIKLLGKRGRPRVENPVRPYRPAQVSGSRFYEKRDAVFKDPFRMA